MECHRSPKWFESACRVSFSPRGAIRRKLLGFPVVNCENDASTSSAQESKVCWFFGKAKKKKKNKFSFRKPNSFRLGKASAIQMGYEDFEWLACFGDLDLLLHEGFLHLLRALIQCFRIDFTLLGENRFQLRVRNHWFVVVHEFLTYL